MSDYYPKCPPEVKCPHCWPQPNANEQSSLAVMPGSVADLRTVSDLLASALVGEYPAEAALKRYCATIASPFDVQVVMAKFRSKPQNADLSGAK
jgi:hypothetical protein